MFKPFEVNVRNTFTVGRMLLVYMTQDLCDSRDLRDKVDELSVCSWFNGVIFISVLLTMTKPSTVWITINCRKFFKRWEYQIT